MTIELIEIIVREFIIHLENVFLHFVFAARLGSYAHF